MVLGLAVLALLVPFTAAGGSAEASVRVRKDVQDLTAKERRAFVGAVLKLKSTPSPYDSELSYYDQFVAWHLELSRCEPTDPLLTDIQKGHVGPMFLPWHREFVLLFERALRRVSGKNIAVPYWDWTDPKSTRAVFSDDFMGGDGDPEDGYAVKSGPFRKGKWELNVQPIGLEWSSSATPYITRHLGGFPDAPLPTKADIRFALAPSRYDVPPYNHESDPAESFRNALEGFRPPLSLVFACGPDGVTAGLPGPGKEHQLHLAVHFWVGGLIFPNAGGARFIGTMANVTASPNDPVFFLHHAMVDRIWAQWQKRHGVDTYLPRSGYAHNNVGDLMHPYDEAGIRVTPEDVADTRELGYRYRLARRAGSGAKKRARPVAVRGGAAAAHPARTRFQCRLARLGVT
jgi:tyrosinase